MDAKQLKAAVRERGWDVACALFGEPAREHGGEGLWRAPYRTDNNPSLRIVKDKSGRTPGDWRDDAEDTGGDIFQLYARVHGLDTKKDFRRIVSACGEAIGLRADDSPTGAAKSSGKSAPLPLDPPWREFAARYGLPQDAWVRAGFEVQTRERGGVVRYPITRPDGVVNGHKVRTIGRPLNDGRKRKAWADPGGLGSDGLIIPASSPPLAGAPVLVLVAGEEKALAAVHSGFPAASLAFGEKGPTPATVEQIKAFGAREVVIAYDAQEPGALKAAQALHAAGQAVSIVQWGDAEKGEDLNDDLREGGTTVVRDRIGSAEPYEPKQAEAVSADPDPDFMEAYNPPPFPLHALPEVVRGVVYNSAHISATDPGMAAIYALGALSAALTGKVIVRMPNFEEPCNLYALVVAKSSERKSAVMGPIMEPIREAGRRAAAKIAETKHEREADKALLSAEKRRIVNAKRPTDEDRRRLNEILSELETLENEAKSPLAISTDTTMEALAIAMASHDESWSIISGEAGIFDIIAGSRYSKTATANLDLMLSAYSGEHFTEQRVGRAGVHMASPALTVCLAAQPTVLARIQRDSETLGGRGFLHRFLYWNVPYKFREETHDRAPDQGARNAWREMLARLLDVKRYSEKRDRFVELSDGAFEAWRPHERAHETATRWNGIASSENFLDAWRGPGSILRIAALLHFATHSREPLNGGREGPFSMKIFPETIDRAAEIVAACRVHARVAYNAMGLRGSNASDMPRVVLAMLQAMRRDGVSLTATHLTDRLRRFDAGTVHAAVAILKAKNVLRTETTHSGGRPCEQYRINLPDQG